MMKTRRVRWARHKARRGKGNTYRVLVGKPGEKTLVERPRRRWEANIKIELREVQKGTMGCGYTWHRIRDSRELL
jgi:hypothetical protein